ncbi:MAG: hypothetical protein IT490_06690 [Candidatus Contendobacter sp.]|nr:hypothetical protein [Candidatus Contendobacter sp.]
MAFPSYFFFYAHWSVWSIYVFRCVIFSFLWCSSLFKNMDRDIYDLFDRYSRIRTTRRLSFFAGSLAVWVLAHRISWLVQIIVIAALLVSFSLSLPQDLINVVFGRTGSGFTSAWDRAIEQTGALFATLDQYFLMGRGIGYFSFGSTSFGGEIFFEHMASQGGAENAWLRIIGEVGVPGLLVVLLIGYYLMAPVVRRMRSSNKADVHVQFVALSAVVSGCLWSFTHDFFGNYLSLGLMGFAIGVARASLRIRDTH